MAPERDPAVAATATRIEGAAFATFFTAAAATLQVGSLKVRQTGLSLISHGLESEIRETYDISGLLGLEECDTEGVGVVGVTE